jgi:hypothetical protein
LQQGQEQPGNSNNQGVLLCLQTSVHPYPLPGSTEKEQQANSKQAAAKMSLAFDEYGRPFIIIRVRFSAPHGSSWKKKTSLI